MSSLKIEVHVKPNARRESIERTAEGIYKVSVNAPAQEGKANAAVIAIVAAHFNVPKRAVVIRRGETGKKKWIEIQR